MKAKKLFLAILLLLTASTIIHADPTEKGKAIFTSRCAACHNINKILTGPALAGVDQRHTIEWIINFVHSSQTVVKGGDKDAIALYLKFNKIVMPDHPDLTEENIKDIVDYVKSATVAVDAKAPFVKPARLTTSYQPLSLTKDYAVFLIYLVVVALLIVTLLFAVSATKLRQKAQNEKIPE